MAFWLDEEGLIVEASTPKPGWTAFDADAHDEHFHNIQLPATVADVTQGPEGETLRSENVPDVSRQSYIEPKLRLSENLNLANFTTGMPNLLRSKFCAYSSAWALLNRRWVISTGGTRISVTRTGRMRDVRRMAAVFFTRPPFRVDE